MVGLLTFTTYGTRLGHRGRGRIAPAGDDAALPEPSPAPAAGPAATSRWPAVRLAASQQEAVLKDLERIAGLRSFTVHMAVAGADHVHVLLACEDGRDVPRLVQLLKGALARALSVSSGEPPPRSDRGEVLPHLKWWARQYSFLVLPDARSVACAVAQLRDHATRAGCRSSGPGGPDRAALERGTL